MVSEPIYCDGYRVRYINGMLVRTNVDHVQRCINAIRQRWANETQYELSSNNVVRLTQKRKCGTVNT